MKKLFFAAVLLCAPLTLAACATTPDAAVHVTQLTAGSYNAADALEITLKGLADAHKLTPVQARRARDLHRQINAALKAADAAQAQADGATAQKNVATASALILQLSAIVETAKKGP